MFYLRKAHIGEIQASIWPQRIEECKNEHTINLKIQINMEVRIEEKWKEVLEI